MGVHHLQSQHISITKIWDMFVPFDIDMVSAVTEQLTADCATKSTKCCYADQLLLQHIVCMRWQNDMSYELRRVLCLSATIQCCDFHMHYLQSALLQAHIHIVHHDSYRQNSRGGHTTTRQTATQQHRSGYLQGLGSGHAQPAGLLSAARHLPASQSAAVQLPASWSAAFLCHPGPLPKPVSPVVQQ